MSYISDFVNQAIAGQKISQKAFKNQYEEFLKAIDEPWQGNVRILFIRIPKEWFKGQISGIRYVEDEPYALYEAALEMFSACLSVLTATKSTPFVPELTMRFTTLFPAPPTPITLIFTTVSGLLSKPNAILLPPAVISANIPAGPG